MTNQISNTVSIAKKAARVAFATVPGPTITITQDTLADLIEASIELYELNRPFVETKVEQPPANFVITYDVVAYHESWGGYGDNASRNGFQSADEAISYAKSCGSHLNAQVWQRTKPNPVATTSIQIYPVVEPSSAL